MIPCNEKGRSPNKAPPPDLRPVVFGYRAAAFVVSIFFFSRRCAPYAPGANPHPTARGRHAPPISGSTFALQTVCGVGIAAPYVAATNTLLQRTVPQAMLGPAFGNLYGVIGAAAGVSYVLGGYLLDFTSPCATFVVALEWRAYS